LRISRDNIVVLSIQPVADDENLPYSPTQPISTVSLLVEFAQRSNFLPVSYAIPLGLIIALVGANLFFVTKYKSAAKIMIGLGAAIAILTLILILLAAYSPT
jgi:hypothetical protein